MQEVIPEVTKEDLTKIQIDMVTLSHSIDLVRDLHKTDHDAIISLKDKLQSVVKMTGELSDELSDAMNHIAEAKKMVSVVEVPAPEQKSILPLVAVLLSIVAIAIHWL